MVLLSNGVIHVISSNENIIYASNTGFYKSVDGGKTFDERISTPHGDNHGVWINPSNSDIMINCNDGGANVSLNGDKSWSTHVNMNEDYSSSRSQI